jgi:hypothetical protein
MVRVRLPLKTKVKTMQGLVFALTATGHAIETIENDYTIFDDTYFDYELVEVIARANERYYFDETD